MNFLLLTSCLLLTSFYHLNLAAGDTSKEYHIPVPSLPMLPSTTYAQAIAQKTSPSVKPGSNKNQWRWPYQLCGRKKRTSRIVACDFESDFEKDCSIDNCLCSTDLNAPLCLIYTPEQLKEFRTYLKHKLLFPVHQAKGPQRKKDLKALIQDANATITKKEQDLIMVAVLNTLSAHKPTRGYSVSDFSTWVCSHPWLQSIIVSFFPDHDTADHETPTTNFYSPKSENPPSLDGYQYNRIDDVFPNNSTPLAEYADYIPAAYTPDFTTYGNLHEWEDFPGPDNDDCLQHGLENTESYNDESEIYITRHKGDRHSKELGTQFYNKKSQRPSSALQKTRKILLSTRSSKQLSEPDIAAFNKSVETRLSCLHKDCACTSEQVQQLLVTGQKVRTYVQAHHLSLRSIDRQLRKLRKIKQSSALPENTNHHDPLPHGITEKALRVATDTYNKSHADQRKQPKTHTCSNVG